MTAFTEMDKPRRRWSRKATFGLLYFILFVGMVGGMAFALSMEIYDNWGPISHWLSERRSGTMIWFVSMIAFVLILAFDKITEA